MKLLLDTHAFLWAVAAPHLLGAAAKAAIQNDENTIFISAASAWEMATKVRSGKWPEATGVEAEFLAVVQAAGYELLPIDAESALRAGRLVGDHRDPFDRMLAAQALRDDIALVSADAKLDSFNVRRVW